MKALLPFFILFSGFSIAQASGALTVQGRIAAPSGVAVTTETDFTIRIRQGSCVLWEESFPDVDMSSTKGAFNFRLGESSNAVTDPGKATSLTQIFDSSSGSIAGEGGCAYSVSAERRLLVQFNDGLGWKSLPDMPITNVPFAMQADRATSALGLRGIDLDFSVAPTNGQVLTYDTGVWKPSTVSGGAGGDIDGVTAGTGLSGGGTTGTVTLDLATSGVTANTYGDASTIPQITVDAYGRITTVTDVAVAISGTALTVGSVAIDRLNTTGTANASTFLRGDGQLATPSPTVDLTSDVTGVLPVTNGGTGVSTLTGDSILASNMTGSGVVAFNGALNQVLGMNGAGTAPEYKTITAGTNVSVVHAANSITINAASTADDLGDHTATQNIQLGSFWLSGDGGNEGLQVNAAGNVLIGGPGTSSELLEVNGNVRATAFISTSDRRLKKDIEDIAGLESILQLQGKKYRWKKDGKVEYGLIAQEVEQVLPDLVVTDPQSGLKAIKYQGLIAPLVESTKELYGFCEGNIKQMQEQGRKISSLEEENRKLREELSEIRALVQGLIQSQKEK